MPAHASASSASGATDQPAQTPRRIPAAVAISCGLYVVVGGAVTLIGWALDLQSLTDWIGAGISMLPNTAVCATMGGIALVLLGSRRRSGRLSLVARILATAVALIGGLTLLQHVFGINFGIDTLLIERSWGQRATASPMRMGPPASSSFMLLGIGLLLATYGLRARRIGSALAIISIAIASLSLVGYVYGVDQLFGVARWTGIAFQTSTMLAALGLGLLATMPECGLVEMLGRNDAGGLLARKLLAPVIAVPLVLGWLRLLGEGAGLYDAAFGLALMVLTMIAMFVLLLFWTARGVSRQAQLAMTAEQAARQRAEEIEKLMDVMPVAVWIARDPQCQHVTGNRAGYKLLRAPAGTNLSATAPSGQEPTHFRIFQAGKEVPPHELPVQYAAAHGVVVRDFEEDIVFDDGDVIHLYGSAAPLFDEQGRVRGGVAAFMDISELRRLEQELRQKVQELALADQRKDEFLATLAHELRNPLAPIRTALEILNRAGSDPELLHQARGVLERQTGHMVRLVDDLLDVSRISSDKLELRKERVELSSLVDVAVETARPHLEESQHHLSMSLPPEPIWLLADPLRLSQVVANLLNNACKYSEPASTIWLSAVREGSDIVISVKDHGIGIAPEKLPDVFAMFGQADHAVERARGGLGIGLTLVKRLVEMHGGSVLARSEGLGCGSDFVVRLPILIESLQRPAPKPAQAKPVKGRRILVVDDNEDAATSLARLLQIAGNVTNLAHDGPQALRAAEQFLPDVVLLDIGLPQLNGYDVCRAIRDAPWGKQMTIIALTGWGQDEDRRKSKLAGFDSHLVKPVDYGSLAELLAQPTSDARAMFAGGR